ncbi:222_t:CDS:1, partial [Gigaspora margarita]
FEITQISFVIPTLKAKDGTNTRNDDPMMISEDMFPTAAKNEI